MQNTQIDYCIYAHFDYKHAKAKQFNHWLNCAFIL